MYVSMIHHVLGVFFLLIFFHHCFFILIFISVHVCETWNRSFGEVKLWWTLSFLPSLWFIISKHRFHSCTIIISIQLNGPLLDKYAVRMHWCSRLGRLRASGGPSRCSCHMILYCLQCLPQWLPIVSPQQNAANGDTTLRLLIRLFVYSICSISANEAGDHIEECSAWHRHEHRHRLLIYSHEREGMSVSAQRFTRGSEQDAC